MKALKKHGELVFDRSLLSESEIASTLHQMAINILECNPDSKTLMLVGIRTGGVFLAQRMARLLSERVSHPIPLGVLDITLYRDDVFEGLPNPDVGQTELPCSLQGRAVILIDDVLYTGRTVRSALMELMDFGRPKSIQLATLVDRGHRELPIQPNFVGFTTKTTLEENVRVSLRENSDRDEVAVFRRPS